MSEVKAKKGVSFSNYSYSAKSNTNWCMNYMVIELFEQQQQSHNMTPAFRNGSIDEMFNKLNSICESYTQTLARDEAMRKCIFLR